ncbi:MAG: Methionyl-tRNA formyltransferase [Microgenomates group bacterium GW2011_GWF2_45_18]|nr:MAG: Methionyl-tRNA formyltransferase [Microgenomates group bacterium GW2011_GWF1_44_10]KKU01373.1 MAG: Methionyl-tRNA formyltransferase [Microgenomates group bacterium GW2011_GWF2_45_18]OGJ41363.1 MAG: hypothetical protein A2378_03675 [Candidatus Pacebacteria bacterium RIFOXYB1_FULL_44_10]HAU98619.1 hypothetical protein [Candidatus Paceibacterota bacterium]HAX01211.1 hypothetical protein [Candidatus Paceibacterota bacterium]
MVASFHNNSILNTNNVRILVAGTPQTTVGVAQTLFDAHYTIVGVLCPFPKPIGRQQHITASPVELWARTKQIPVFHCDHHQLNTEGQSLSPLQSLLQTAVGKIDLLVVADFGFLIPKWMLDMSRFGGLNIHPSRLPRWRGAGPVPFTLLFGDTDSAVSIIRMSEIFDLGAIVAQRDLPVFPRDTTGTLLARGFEVGQSLLIDILPKYLDGTIHPIPQPTNSPTPMTYKKDLAKEWGFIPWSTLQFAMGNTKTYESVPLFEKYALPTTAEQLDRMIRAFSPKPLAWTILPNEKRMIIHSANISGKTLSLNEVQVEGKEKLLFSHIEKEIKEST